MVRALSVVELAVGALLALGAAALFANAQFCWFYRAACGMWEPIFAVYALAIAIPVLVAGLLHRSRRNIAAAIAYVPAAFVVVVLVGQAQQWW